MSKSVEIDLIPQVLSMGLENFRNNIINFKNSIPEISVEIASEVSKELDPRLKEVVNNSINLFYSQRPVGVKYDPTGNLKNITGEIKVEGYEIYARIHGDEMSAYPGFWGDPLDAGTAYTFMFEGGEHGHGRFYRGGTSPTPLQDVKNNVTNFQDIMNSVVQRVIFEKLGL